MSAPVSVEAYIAGAREEVRPILEAIRATIRAAAPLAEERISYGMPAFFQQGALVYFAAFQRHIGLYPPVREPDLLDAVRPYAGPKGNLQFPLAEPIPYDLIRRIVVARVRGRCAEGSGVRHSKRSSPSGK